MTPKHPKILWNPSESIKTNSNLATYMSWLRDHRGLTFSNYDALWEWSVSDTRAFWQSIYEYFEVISHHSYTEVQSDDPMPDTRWFEGAKLNYAEHIFRNKTEQHPAIIFKAEGRNTEEISWKQLHDQVAAMASFMKGSGVQKGDRVVAFLPNCPKATIGFLAACSIGAVWSSCSPDFGPSSVVDRFQQIAPKMLITVDGYRYGGKEFDKREVVSEIVSRLTTLQTIVEIPYLQKEKILPQSVDWAEAVQTSFEALIFTPVDFSDPIWVLYSSGTTGQPKAITHSHGGTLLEHLKYVSFHNDVKSGERYFWFTTTGWMMWNFVQATLLVGATIVLYDGSPGYPDLNVLWQMAQDHQIHHFGTSAPYIVACMKAALAPGRDFDLKTLRSISSTGSPLPPEGFDWVYEAVSTDLWLCSMSGGTDVCSAFVGGCPLEPVYEGEIQRRALGCAMYAFDDAGQPLVGEVGEMVVTKPMPSMPVYFWNDPGKARYRESYFEMFPDIWRHGDWLLITARNTLVIQGRSDATLNRHGVRIGTAEIYQSVSKIETIVDSLVVNLELDGGRHFMPLFVVLKEGQALDDPLVRQIGHQLKTDFSPRHIPDTVVLVQDLPYTISGKKMEAPVKKILMGKPVEKAANLGAMRNPGSLDFFVAYAKEVPV
ncbi:MAG: acetoacetate--CoA ligase [Marinoscillum sp.]|uniref:acetoacetate--CoA ligase n=1 Tax=Marinoscillum sp. TaxID=2024838 RepID=UPI003302FB9A